MKFITDCQIRVSQDAQISNENLKKVKDLLEYHIDVSAFVIGENGQLGIELLNLSSGKRITHWLPGYIGGLFETVK